MLISIFKNQASSHKLLKLKLFVYYIKPCKNTRTIAFPEHRIHPILVNKPILLLLALHLTNPAFKVAFLFPCISRFDLYPFMIASPISTLIQLGQLRACPSILCVPIRSVEEIFDAVACLG